VLATELARQGATVAFGVPGGGPNLDVVGAFEQSGIRFVLAHTETAACIMASTWGWLTGSVTAVVVTRGPGAASAVNGAAQATLDRQPLLLVTDTVPQKSRVRVPHQRIDQQAMLAPVCKVSQVLGGDASSDQVAALIEIASIKPAGAVHVDYDASATSPDHAPVTATTVTDESALVRAKEMVGAAHRPVVLLGVGAAQAVDAIQGAIEDFGAPVLTTYQGTGVVASEHALNAGLFTNGMSERPLLEQADLIITIGLDFVEPIPAAWSYEAPVVSMASHESQDPYMDQASEVTGDLAELVPQILSSRNHAWTHDAGERYRSLVRARYLEGESLDSFGPLSLVRSLVSHVPREALVTVDAGAHFLAIMPFWPVAEPKSLLISNGLATMGYAVPAAIGAAFARPDQPVVALTGDGGLGMCLAELETISRYDLPITVVVFNDAALSLIKIKQQDHHGGDTAVHYRETDFAAVAQAMGIESTRAESALDIERILSSRTSQGPLLIDAYIDPSSYAHLLAVTRG